MPKSKIKENGNQNHSETVFSLFDKESENYNELKRNIQTAGRDTQQHIDNLLTPGICGNLASTESQLQENVELLNNELHTPMQNDDSDQSVLEETPQKDLSSSKLKQKNDLTSKTNYKNKSKSVSTEIKRIINVQNESPSKLQNVRNIITLSDTNSISNKSGECVTVIEVKEKPKALETPLTISKFVDQIKYNSTPVAKKSLDFGNANMENKNVSFDQTLCPSLVVTTTQEKEFMNKAFEKTPNNSPGKKVLTTRKLINKENKKFCVAGSCLSTSELINIKVLCTKHNWVFVDKYTNNLTHLIVSVDEENKSRRSVKYMCALAAGKWIVSYAWIQKCIQTQEIVDEAPYEVLDSTGDPGPMRSRTALHKLFHGITFFCMPPFSILDVDTLKNMLVSAGGRVVDEVEAARACADAPALVLAEPENTQEDRFIYLRLELGIVPVNFEWALNCLGSYALSSVHELLLCPASLLPAVTAHWPEAIMAKDTD